MVVFDVRVTPSNDGCKGSVRLLSGFVLFLFLFLQAMATSPTLHALVHSDASEAGHECAVTLFAHGQIDAASAPPIVFFVPTRVVVEQSLPVIVFVSSDLRLLPGRGPPASASLI